MIKWLTFVMITLALFHISKIIYECTNSSSRQEDAIKKTAIRRRYRQGCFTKDICSNGFLIMMLRIKYINEADVS